MSSLNFGKKETSTAKPRLLTIAGSDPSGGAGIQADLKTFTVLGGYGMTVITALTAQNTCGVKGVHEVPVQFVDAQLEAVLSDIPCDAVKIGMLCSEAIISGVSRMLRHFQPPLVILDPVMVAKGGAALLAPEAIAALRDMLLPLATVTTPNIPEAAALLERDINSSEDMEKAALDLLEHGPGAVLLKGGHGAHASSDDCLVGRKPDGAKFVEWFRSERIPTKNTHGTGCTLSSALAYYLAIGLPLTTAIENSKRFITEAIRSGATDSIGTGHGPVDHLFERNR